MILNFFVNNDENYEENLLKLMTVLHNENLLIVTDNIKYIQPTPSHSDGYYWIMAIKR